MDLHEDLVDIVQVLHREVLECQILASLGVHLHDDMLLDQSSTLDDIGQGVKFVSCGLLTHLTKTYFGKHVGVGLVVALRRSSHRAVVLVVY